MRKFNSNQDENVQKMFASERKLSRPQIHSSFMWACELFEMFLQLSTFSVQLEKSYFLV